MTESTTSSPHDAVFKTFMFTPETARDFLEIHLPEPLRKLCNLQTLRLEPTSFIEKSLRAYYSDVLWSVETSDGEGYISYRGSSWERVETEQNCNVCLKAYTRNVDSWN